MNDFNTCLLFGCNLVKTVISFKKICRTLEISLPDEFIIEFDKGIDGLNEEFKDSGYTFKKWEEMGK